MEKDTMYDIYQRKSVMRCLDLYGNQPEKDGAILIGILIGKSLLCLGKTIFPT